MDSNGAKIGGELFPILIRVGIFFAEKESKFDNLRFFFFSFLLILS